MSAPLVTVFTPTFNRAGKLHRVFHSLQKQTLRDFEWLIIDDGSTDDTRQVVEDFRLQHPGFPIHYYFQQNSGKHIAHNKALLLAKGEWFHIADSDDELEPATLEILLHTWDGIPAGERHLFGGVAACCKDQFGKRISDPVPGAVFDGGFRELFYKYSFRKEVFMINRTSIMRKYPFPVGIVQQLFPEGIIWRRMTDKYKLRFINDELRIYYVQEAGALTTQKRSPARRALPNCLESSSVLNEDLRFFKYAPAYFFKMALVYHSFLPYLDKSEADWVSLRPTARRFAWPMLLPGRILKMIMDARYKK